LTFVAYRVPLRDRCGDPDALDGAPRVALVRDDGASETVGGAAGRLPGCTLLRPSGAAHLDAARCAELRCEPGLLSSLRGSDFRLLALLYTLSLGSTLVWAARWRRLLLLANLRLSLGWVWRVTLQSMAAGVLLPGGVGGDALRVASAMGAGSKTAVAVGSVLLDRAIGLTTVAALGAAAGATMAGAGNGVTVVVLALIPVGFVLGLALLRSRIVRTSRFLERGILARTVKPIVAYLGDPGAIRAIVGCVLLSFLVSAVQLGVNRGLIASIGVVPTSERWVYVGMTFIFTVGAVPALPGGWGTVDAAYVYFLGLAGLAPSSALAVCLLWRLFWYLSGAVGSVLLLARPIPLGPGPPERAQDHP
jgi:hypothetical protein